MGGKAPEVPGPSPAEQALQAQQAKTLALQQSIIEKQNKTQELLAPILYKNMGITPQYDEQGNISGFTEAPDPLRDQAKAIQAKFYERTQNALEGKLNVDPGLINGLDEQEQQLRERLRKQLGPGYETSSPGVEALSKFNLNKQNILEGARRGDLTMAEQLGLAQQSANLGQQGQNFGQALGLTGAPLGAASALAGVSSGYGNAANALASERLGQYSAQMAGYQNQQKSFGQLFGGLGNLAGLGLFAPTGGTLFGSLLGGGAAASTAGSSIASLAPAIGSMFFSDARIKKDIRPIGRTEGGLPVYSFKYKGTDGPTHTGVMAQDVMKVNPDAVTKFGDIFAVDYARVN